MDYSDPDLIHLAKALEADGSIRKFYYRGNLVAGGLLSDHAEMDVLEDYQLESAYSVTRQFIVECNGEPV